MAQSVPRLGYGLDGRGVEIRFPARGRDISLLHNVQTGYEVHLASYTMGTVGCFPGSKGAGA
jgi:hypothetical protein